MLTHGYSKFLFDMLKAAMQGTSTSSRQAFWFVPSGCSCAYEYGPFTSPANTIPEHLRALGADICQIVDLPVVLNSVNLNAYYGAKQQLKWHSDDEEIMGQAPFIFPYL